MAITLPPPIAAYFAADAKNDVAAFLRLFTEDAVVIDERQSHMGHDQIRAWKTDASSRFTYTVEPTGIDTADGQTIVTGHLVGDFPGSPVDLRYRFTLHGDLIAALEIAP